MGDLHETNIKPASSTASASRASANAARSASSTAFASLASANAARSASSAVSPSASADRPDLDTALRKYADSDFCPMHMPGHKRKSVFEIKDYMKMGSTSEKEPPQPCNGRERSFVRGALDIPVERMDITEIDGFDNLHRPEGLIADIESGLADLYHVPAAKLSVGGSTVGLLSAITAVTKPGDRVLIARNCHAAVYHAALVQGLEVDYLLPEADGSIAAETVADAFENKALARMINALADGQLQDILDGTGKPDTPKSNDRTKPVRDRALDGKPYKAVILTCPTYEGMMSDIEAIAKIVHAHGAVLIVDAAHGAHLGISAEPIFPENPIHCGADIAVVSLHKTLPALTMTAAILLAPHAASGNREGDASGRAGTGEAIRTVPSCVPTEGDASGKVGAGGLDPANCLLSAVASALDIYETSSPSYVLMASVARMRRLLKTDGEQLFARYADRLEKFYKDAAALKDPAVLPYFGRDPSKIVIVSKNDIINRFRTEYHIELEMASLSYALAMTSIADSDENFDRLLAALSDMNTSSAEDFSAGRGSSAEGVKQKSGQAKAHLPRQTAIAGAPAGSRSALAGFPGGVFTLDMPFTAENYTLPEQALSIRSAYFADAEEVPLGAAAGRVSVAFVSVFPPEIPLLVPGERIGEPEIRLLQSAAARGFTIHGVESGRVKVVNQDCGYKQADFGF